MDIDVHDHNWFGMPQDFAGDISYSLSGLVFNVTLWNFSYQE